MSEEQRSGLVVRCPPSINCSGCVKSQVSLYGGNGINLHVKNIFLPIGDFHFLWECARVILLAFWGKVNDPGSLCNLRNCINRNLVDKQGKTFSVTDEFICHAFEAHLTAAICEELQLESPEDDIPHELSLNWLEALAKSIVEKQIMPSDTCDPTHALHKSFLYCAFMYVDLRRAIRNDEGEHIIRYWKHWLVLFLGTNRKNYSTEALTLLCNLASTFPRHIAYIVTHNRTVNTTGKSHNGKPLDQMLEHYNLLVVEIT